MKDPARLFSLFGAATLLLFLSVACEKAAPPVRVPVPVTVAQAVKSDVPVSLRAIGTVEPMQTVAVKAQVGGEIQDVGFAEGQEVASGQVLFRIDPRPYKAALAQAQANLERDRALALYADQNVKRYEELVKKDYVTKQQYDSAKSGSDASKATLQADEAAVERASLDLEYCTIHAPIGGRVGSLLVKKGNVVKANDAPLVIIHQIRPILVRFALPAENLPDIQRFSAQRTLKVRAYPARDGQNAITGALDFIDNSVDPSTDTITLKARFENGDSQLWPGQFLDLSLDLDVLAGAIVIPSQSVQTGQLGSTVFVVASDGTAVLRPVKIGRSLDGQVVVTDGLEPGEQVVTDGQLRLVPGAKVEIKASVESAATAGVSR